MGSLTTAKDVMNMFVLFNIVSGNVANLALRILDAKPSFNLKAWFSIYNSKTKFASLPRTILINTNIFNFKIEVSRKKCKKNPGQKIRMSKNDEHHAWAQFSSDTALMDREFHMIHKCLSMSRVSEEKWFHAHDGITYYC